MKIRNKHLLRAAGWLATRSARGLIRTLRPDYRPLGPAVVPCTLVPPGPRIVYCIWHEYLLYPAAKFGHPDLSVLISKHTDGVRIQRLHDSFRRAITLHARFVNSFSNLRTVLNECNEVLSKCLRFR